MPAGGLLLSSSSLCVCESVCACVSAESPTRVSQFETPQTVAHQAPPPMGISRREDWLVGCHVLFQGVFLAP